MIGGRLSKDIQLSDWRLFSRNSPTIADKRTYGQGNQVGKARNVLVFTSLFSIFSFCWHGKDSISAHVFKIEPPLLAIIRLAIAHQIVSLNGEATCQ
jgi:hypothetical protein